MTYQLLLWSLISTSGSAIFSKSSSICETCSLSLSFPGDHVNKDIAIFKSRVANAVLDYMEAQSDSDLIECLEKS